MSIFFLIHRVIYLFLYCTACVLTANVMAVPAAAAVAASKEVDYLLQCRTKEDDELLNQAFDQERDAQRQGPQNKRAPAPKPHGIARHILPPGQTARPISTRYPLHLLLPRGM